MAMLTAALFLLSFGCARERPSENPPIHLNPDMDIQPRYNPQSTSEFFDDGAASRVPPAGTVARGFLRDDDSYFRGIDENGEHVDEAPVYVTLKLLKRGRERYDIFCSPCHGRVGDGKGIMVDRGYVPPPTFHSDRVREFPDGYIFEVITNGVRNMPSYGHQIPPDDRWAILEYFRALQRSQSAGADDVPVELRDKLKQ